MQRILEHTKLIAKMEQLKMYLDFVQIFELEKIFKCCTKLIDKNVPEELYIKSKTIQKELIKDETFIDYLIEMNCFEISKQSIESLVQVIQEHNKRVSEYKIELLIEMLKNTRFDENSYYDYLEHFSNKVQDVQMQNIVADNLKYFHYQNEVAMSDLSIDEKDIFLLPFMSDHNLIPIDNIKKVCELLIQDSNLKNIINFLYFNQLNIPLNIEEYEAIHKSSEEIYQYFRKIKNLLNNEQMYEILLIWLENGHLVYDLKILENKLKGLESEQIEKIYYNKSSYINFIYGNQLSNFSCASLYNYQENLIIYAISNHKRRFLQLITDNSEIFMDLSRNCIIFNEEFYKNYININTLTNKNFVDLKNMQYSKTNFYSLVPNIYTFEEMKLLYDAPKQYLLVYNHLLDLKVDKRLLIIKQLLKKQLLKGKDLNDEQIISLTEKLKEKNLYNWLDKDFNHIKNLKPVNVIDMLINYNYIKKFIPQIFNQNELLYVLRNSDKIQKYNNLNEIKEHIVEIDEYWNKLVECMKLSNEFITNYTETIKNFLLNNGAELALTYYKNIDNDKLKEGFIKIVKAELMGEFKKLKYYRDDLKREVNFNFDDYQIKEWTSSNITITTQDNSIEIGEYDDFYSTMILGEAPERTCLSYKDGGYNNCLLACFDSNKKILYAKINDEIVGRAMVRLTKGTYNKSTQNFNEFSFVDLENQKIEESSESQEYLTIFLELPYIAGVSPEQKKTIEKMFIKLLEKKATIMNALLVLSKCYSSVENENYVMTKYYMYISKSKAGKQYLDSLYGQNGITDEGQYKSNVFMIWQNNEKRFL